MRLTVISSAMLACAFGLGTVCAAGAQAKKPDKMDQKECDKAARIVEKGHPAKKEQAAFLTLTACGATGAQALAAGVVTYAHDTDPATIDSYMWYVDSWRDATIMNAVTTLATNASATPAARVFAVRHLLRLLQPSVIRPYVSLIAGDQTTQEGDVEVTRTGCAALLTSATPDFVGTPLPADFASRIRSTLATLVSSPSTPTIVRDAAKCAS